MIEGSEGLSQFTLESERLPIYNFPKGTMIWPEHTGRGVVQNENGLNANPVLDRRGKQQKVKNLSLWKSLETARLYRDRRFWSLPEHSQFTAYKSNARRVRVKK